MIVVEGRDAFDGLPKRLTIEGPRIVRVDALDLNHAGDDWFAPAFWDIQTNGRLGVSYSDPTITPAQAAEIILAQAALGVARLCPTLITAAPAAMRRGAASIARACEQDDAVGRMVAAIHLEGPWISAIDGYRGAHPVEAIRDPDWDEFQSIQDAAVGRVGLVTLAPERPGAIAFIERLRTEGVVVAIGHTAADAATLDAAVSAGATIATHLGNGIASPLVRHPNPIWLQAGDDRLFASFIADGHHLDRATLRVLARAKTPGRCVLVSDASPLAGLAPGTYGPWAVDAAGKVVVAGSPYLAGSNRDLAFAVNELAAATGWDLAEALKCASVRPAIALGRREPRLVEGEPANVVVFRRDDGFRLVETYVDGRPHAAANANDPARRGPDGVERI